jgi:hypothetical protein
VRLVRGLRGVVSQVDGEEAWKRGRGRGRMSREYDSIALLAPPMVGDLEGLKRGTRGDIEREREREGGDGEGMKWRGEKDGDS